MKRLFVILMTCIMIFSFTSCEFGNDVVDSSNANKAVIEFDKVIDRDDVIEIKDTGDALYSIKVNAFADSMSIEVYDKPSNLLQVSDDAYIATGITVPSTAKGLENSTKVLTLKGSDLGISTTGHVLITKMKVSSDMKIEETNPDDLAYFTPEQYPVYEEYYHLTQADIKKLVKDPSKVLLTTHSYGSGTGSSYFAFVSIDDNGNIIKLPNTLGLYDLSTYESIDIINSMTVRSSNNKWSREIILSTPDVIEVETEYELPEVKTYIVPESNGVEYVIELKYEPDDVWVDNMFGYRSLKTGLNNEQPMPMALGYRNLYYLGKVTEDSLIDISAYPNSDKISSLGTFVVRPITPEESSILNNQRIISVDSATVEIELKPWTYQELDFRLDPKLGDLSKKKVEVSAKIDGKYYDDSFVSASLMNRFQSGYGYATSMLEGPYGIYESVDYGYNTIEILDVIQVSIENHSNQPRTVTLSVKVSDISENKLPQRHVWMLPWEPEKDPVELEFEEYPNLMVKLPECPEKREGFVFKGWKMIENYPVVVKQPGDMIQFTSDSMTLSPVWEAVETTK